MNSFTENKFYVLSGQGENWSDYEGPFDTINEAVEHLAKFASDYTTPEMRKMVVTHFKNNAIDLVKNDNGVPINVALLLNVNEVKYNGKTVWYFNG